MKKYPIIFLFFFFILLPSQIAAVDKIFYPNFDTSVNQSAPAVSNWDNEDMVVAYNRDNNKQQMILLDFPFVMPANAKLTKATLTMTFRGGSGQSAAIDLLVMKIMDPWVERATWSTKPRLRMGYGSKAVDNFQRTVTFDVTSLVQEWIDSPIQTTGMAIAIDDFPEPPTFDRIFASEEVLNAKPKLTISYSLVGQGNNIGNVALQSNIPALNIAQLDLSDSTAPTISDIQITNISYSQATVSWKTNENASSWVFYGNANNGDQFNLQTGQSDAVTTHNVTLSSLEQNTTYSLKVMSKDASNNQTYGEISHFTTAIENNPVANAAETTSSSVQTGSDHVDSNIVQDFKDTVENKVVDYSLKKSMEASNEANQPPGSMGALDGKQLDTSSLIALLLKQLGLNKLAITLIIVIGVMGVIMLYLIFKVTHKAHTHIKKHLQKKIEEDEEM